MGSLTFPCPVWRGIGNSVDDLPTEQAPDPKYTDRFFLTPIQLPIFPPGDYFLLKGFGFAAALSSYALIKTNQNEIRQHLIHHCIHLWKVQNCWIGKKDLFLSFLGMLLICWAQDDLIGFLQSSRRSLFCKWKPSLRGVRNFDQVCRVTAGI